MIDEPVYPSEMEQDRSKPKEETKKESKKFSFKDKDTSK